MKPAILDRASVTEPFDWPLYVDALEAAHRRPRAVLEDVFLGPKDKTLLSRAAWIDGLGYGVKSVTVFAANKDVGLPSVQGSMLVFNPDNGQLRGIIDSALITDIKTAADSVLGAKLLARRDARHHLIVGAGSVSYNVAQAYRAVLPNLTKLTIWNRNSEKAQRLAETLGEQGIQAAVASDLSQAASSADIITTATMSPRPVLFGDWVKPGTHVDLIGAFKADMREADDALMQKGRIFVDSFDTTVDHIGELAIPLSDGVISKSDILGDLNQLVRSDCGRASKADITVFKNGGGAHLDLMVANVLLERHT